MSNVVFREKKRAGKPTIFETGVKVGHRTVMFMQFIGEKERDKAMNRVLWLQQLVKRSPESFEAERKL